MSSELYLPPRNAKLTDESEFVKAEKASKMDFVRKHIIRDVQRKNALAVNCKPVDVFDLQGHYVTTFPSYTEAERKLGLSRCAVTQCMNGRNRSWSGYQFRAHVDDHPADIAPVPPRDLSKFIASRPERANKRACKVINIEDGSEKIYEAVIDAERELGCTIGYANRLIRSGRPFQKKYIIKYLDK